jgi:excisionase family DNA binding protein
MNPVMEVGMPRDLELAPHKLGYTVAEAVALTGVSRTRLYQENKASRLKFVKIGQRTLVTRTDLEAWLDLLRRSV